MNDLRYVTLNTSKALCFFMQDVYICCLFSEIDYAILKKCNNTKQCLHGMWNKVNGYTPHLMYVHVYVLTGCRMLQLIYECTQRWFFTLIVYLYCNTSNTFAIISYRYLQTEFLSLPISTLSNTYAVLYSSHRNKK